MNIHLVSAQACRAGGGDVYTEELALGLAERGHHVTVICHGASERVRQVCETAVADLPDYDAWRGLWRIGPWLRWRFWQSYLARVQVSTPDVIICSKGVCAAAAARRFPGVPLVYLPHSRIEPVEVEGMLGCGASPLQKWLACSISAGCERWSLTHSATTVRFTRENVTELRRHYHLPENARFDVIPAGVVGPESLEPRETNVPPRLLSVGRLVESKNLRLLLDVLGTLRDLSWILDIVGDGPERAKLEQQATQQGLSERVRFQGHREEVGTFYRQADLFVFPSRLESFGLVVLEAMSYGVPTLAIRADGERYRNANHEIITPDRDGLLADEEQAFAEKLHDCLRDPRRLWVLGWRARQTYLQRHQWPVVIDRWEELLQQLVPADDGLARRRPEPLVSLATGTEA
jgi:glycosyltransferase involved in cell wall biosynthesis